MVYGKDNQKFKTSFTTIDAKKVNAAQTTHITLLKIDGKYYLDKMFIAGRIYGYQVALPDSIRDQVTSAESEDINGSKLP